MIFFWQIVHLNNASRNIMCLNRNKVSKFNSFRYPSTYDRRAWWLIRNSTLVLVIKEQELDIVININTHQDKVAILLLYF